MITIKIVRGIKMKKVLVIFFCIFFICPCAYGFWFKKKNLNYIDKKEKLEFVNMTWWEKFKDPYLTCYIATAVINNHDARKASFKVKEYKEFVKYQFGQELPSIETGANYYGIHLPKTEAEILYRENVFTIPFTAKYQADIFLKNRNKTKSREKEVEMSKFQEKSVYISLATSVATDYLNILKYDKKISIQQRVIKIKQESLIREKNKFSRGVSTQLKVNELKKATEVSKNSLENLISSRTKALTELSTLIGDSPENISNLKRGTFDKFDFHGKIPNCIKSEVIFTRPDILEKEAGLEKAQIDIKIARKELLPSINISASYIFTNLANQNFFNWNSAIASVVAGDRKSTRLNSSHQIISYAVFCLKKKKEKQQGKNRKTRGKGERECKKEIRAR